MRDTLQKQFAEIDECIKKAQGSLAKEKVVELFKKKIPFELLCQAASLARRASLPELAVRHLSPIVSPKNRVKREATPELKVEYSASLIRLGAQNAALKLLGSVSFEKIPDVLFLSALAYFKEWNYKDALPLLQSYVKRNDISPYQRLVGNLNLGTALVYEDHLEEAGTVLHAVVEGAHQQKSDLVAGIAMRYLGTREIKLSDWKRAMSYFQKSSAILSQSGGIDLFFSQKWVAIGNYMPDPRNRLARNDIAMIRNEAIRIRHWESVRDVDFHIALATEDEHLFEHLYFGTPHASYRKKVLKFWNPQPMPDSYLWVLKAGPSKRKPFVLENAAIPLKVGQALYHLYCAFTSDFYRPWLLTELFEKAYPEIPYVPQFSEARVHQLLDRFKKWLIQVRFPATVEQEDGAYRLAALVPFSLSVSSEPGYRSRPVQRLASVQDKLPEQFTVKQLSSLLDLSPRRAGELLFEALKEGVITKMGAGNKVSYQFTSPSESAHIRCPSYFKLER